MRIVISQRLINLIVLTLICKVVRHVHIVKTLCQENHHKLKPFLYQNLTLKVLTNLFHGNKYVGVVIV